MSARLCLAVLSILSACVAGRADESEWLSNTRQLTFDGRRAGEGYFSSDGSLLVFQSERAAANPFFQIFLMDWATGDVTSVSPGQGKTTCAWVHPDNNRILFASTHHDPKSVEKQQAELELRASGKERRYSWDYDASFELFAFDREKNEYTRLTNTPGYDAEGSYSPDGALIAFASNRRAYGNSMSPAERVAFEVDPAVMNDIYVMNADGTNVRRITETLGYDGGPFFSPDGSRICWRRFAENGATAEIMTMNLDGTDKRQLTHLDSMSWAPFYHPSGEYLIFTTNLNGFANFELYIVDKDGQQEPVRITTTDGFDGLPAFTPDGKQLTWTSNRTNSKQSQIFIADWNHEAALKTLGKSQDSTTRSAVDPLAAATNATKASESDFKAIDMMRHVDYLCRPELAGRLTGTPGEHLATAYVAAVFDQLGIETMIGEKEWFQDFEFTAGVDLGSNNRLSSTGNNLAYEIGNDWQPLAFSETGTISSADVVFAGYGIVAPKDGDFDEYDSYVHLDVKGKWVCVLRFMPEDISAERRQHLSGHSSLRYKAMVARDRGAHGLIVVSGPRSKVKHQLIKLQFDGSMGGSSIPVISVRDDVVDGWLAGHGKKLADLQAALDTGDLAMGFTVDGLSLEAEISIQKVRKQGRNVLGTLKAKHNPNHEAIIVGAHIDHLGAGANSSSLAREDESDKIHFGADDNASGIAAMLEIAEYLSNEQRLGRLELKRDVIFAAWSGEELGLIGSSAFVTQYAHQLPDRLVSANDAAEGNESQQPTTEQAGAAHATPPHAAHDRTHSIYPSIAACLNMDMVGRFEKRLVLQGIGSSSVWKGEIERRNAPIGLPITLQDDSYLPTDASTFYMQGVPILSAFTGSHSDYHTPRDTPDKLNYVAAAKIAKLMGSIARSLVLRDDAPDYQQQVAPGKGKQRARLRAYLGTIPDYAESDVKGLKLSGVAKNGPAAKAGLKAGDLIVELAGKKIENIYDYTYAIEALKIGQEVTCVVSRGGQTVSLKMIPGSRD